MSEDCLFCKIAAGDIPSTEVYSDDDFYAFEDIHPVAPTHVLIVPRKHIPKIADIESGDTELIGRMFVVANAIAAQRGLASDGYRYIINCGKHGGQEVFHIHLHLLGGEPIGPMRVR